MEYFAALVVKLLVKHGWPAVAEVAKWDDMFFVLHKFRGDQIAPDFEEAIGIAVRIIARTYRVDCYCSRATVVFNRSYAVTKGGGFKEVVE